MTIRGDGPKIPLGAAGVSASGGAVVDAVAGPARVPTLSLRRVSEYSVADALATAISVVGLVIVVRTLRVEEFGLADFLRSAQLLVGSVVGLNLFDGASRFYFETGDLEERRRILGGGITAVLVTGITAAVLLGLLQPLWQLVSTLELPADAVWVAAIGIPANNMMMAVTQTAVLRGASRLYAGLVLAQACLSSIGTVVLVVWARAGLEGYLLALAIAAAFTAAIGYALQANEYRWGWTHGPLRAYIAFGMPFTITAILQHAHGLFVRVLVAQLAPPAALGWYGLAERIQAPLKLVISATGKVWLPWLFSSQLPLHAPIGRAVFRLNGIVLTAQAVLIAFLPEAIRLLGGDSYAPAYTAALLLLISGWVHFLGDWIISGSLAVAKQTRHRVIVHAVAVAVAAPVGVIAVARWGSAGAALSVLVAATVVLIGMLRAAAVAYPLRFGLLRVLPASATVIVLAVTVSMQASVGTKLFLLCAGAGGWALIHAQRAVYSRG